MKLLRLKLNSSFRSLPKGFELYFLRDFDYGDAFNFNPYILAGLNGSGKSNVLEALAYIFYHLDVIYLNNKPNFFEDEETKTKGFDPKKSIVDAYELEYFIQLDLGGSLGEADFAENLAHVKIIKEIEKRPEVEWLNEENYRTPEPLSRATIKTLLPACVVAYASGNNETLSIPFLKSRLLQYDEYLSNLESRTFSNLTPESSLVYLDEQYSQAILLTILLMWEDEWNMDEIPKPFKKYVGLLDIDSFDLTIRLDKEVLVNVIDKEEEEKISLLENINLEQEHDSPFNLSYLERLRRCATVVYEKEEEIDETEYEENEDFYRKRYLHLGYKVNKATKEAFRFHFDSGRLNYDKPHDSLKLFQFFQLLFSLDLCVLSEVKKKAIYSSNNIFLADEMAVHLPEEDRIFRIENFKIKKKQLEEPLLTKGLSDGEHQFLHSLGLCLLFRQKRALFLFDEPETHFNPDWKAKFISSIRDCLPQKGDFEKLIMREMLITTHSPFLISDSKMEYVLVFEKEEKTNKVKSALRPNFKTFGASVNKIGILIFKMPNTIGEFAASKLGEFKKELDKLNSKEELEDLIRRTQKELGESVERTLFVNQVFEKIKAIS